MSRGGIGAVALVLAVLLLPLPATQSISVTEGTERWQVWPELDVEDGVAHLIWIKKTDEWNGATDLMYSHSTDGENWSEPARLNYVQGHVLSRYHQEHPTIAVQGDEVRVFWVSQAVSPHQIRSIYSSDSGQTWRVGGFTYDMDDENHLTDFLTAEFDSSGGLHLMWQDVRGHEVERQMMVVSSANGGEIWSDAQAVDPFNTGHLSNPEGGYSCECCRHAFVASADGELDIVFRQVDRYPDNETWYMYTGFVHWDGQSGATEPVQVGGIWVTGGRICPENGPQIASTDEGLAVVWNAGGQTYIAHGNSTGFAEEASLTQGFSPALDYFGGSVYFASHDADNVVHIVRIDENGLLVEVFTGGEVYERFASLDGGMVAYQRYDSESWEIHTEVYALTSPPSDPQPEQETCGGFVGATCSDGFECVDDPEDDCDPQKGGADCMGICVPEPGNETGEPEPGNETGEPEPEEEAGEAEEEASDVPRAAQGGVAPDFTLVDTEGVEFALSDYLGQVVVLDFMATWCPNCEQIAQETLVPMQADLNSGALEGVAIISIGTDLGETNAMLAGFSEQKGYGWRHAIDTEVGQCREKYSSLVPTVAVVDQSGVVTYLGTGYVSSEVLRGLVDDLAGFEPAPATDEGSDLLPGFEALLALSALFLAATARIERD